MLKYTLAFLFNKLYKGKRIGRDFDNIRRCGRLAEKLVEKTGHYSALLLLSGVKSVKLGGTRGLC